MSAAGTAAVPAALAGWWLAAGGLPAEGIAGFSIAVAATLAEASLRAVPLLAAGLLFARLRPRSAPALRHVLLASALVATLAMPWLAAVLPGWAVPWPQAAADWITGGAAGGGLGPAADEGAVAARSAGAGEAVADGSTWSPGLLAVVWIAGTAFLLLRLAVGVAGVARLRRAAATDGIPWPPASVPAPSPTAGAPERRRGTVLVTAAVAVPVALGGRRPLVLLPPAAAGWPADELRAVAAHERAHLSRRDPATLLVAALVTALYWPNPLVWLVARRLHRAAEEACDRAAVASGLAPDRYAALLVRLARRRGADRLPRLATAASGRGLSARVEALVRGGHRPAARWALAAAVLVSVLATGALAALRPGAAPAVGAGEGAVEVAGSATTPPGRLAAGHDPRPARSDPPARRRDTPSWPGTDPAHLDRPSSPAHPSASSAPAAYAARYGVDEALAADVLSAAQGEGIEPAVAFGLVGVESGFDPSRTSPRGAVGLTQILPASAATVEPGVDPATLHEPAVNLRLGFRLLRSYLDRFGGDRDRALLAYHVGPVRVARPGPPPDSDYPDRVLAAARGR